MRAAADVVSSVQPRSEIEYSTASVRARLPLSMLLSQVLVAFTIEFDNEFERQMPHRTTTSRSAAGSRQGPWLVSLVMWSNCMRFVRDEGISVGELQDLTRTKTNLDGMQRWGYIVVEPDPAGSRLKPARSNGVIRPTEKGRRAQEVWRPLFGVIEKRWQGRFGKRQINELRASLEALVSQFDLDLPDCLPILGYGLFSRGSDRERRASAPREDGTGSLLALPALISRALLAFAIEFERQSDLSLAISANVVRVLDEKGVRVRDLPLLSGVSREAISMATGVLQKRGVVVIQPDPTARRTKLVRLTPKGRKAQEAYRQLSWMIEQRWQARFGKDAIGDLRESLERLVGEPTAQSSPLFRGLEHHPNGWRASVRKPQLLPHYPMVLHRGGYPDGS